MHKFNMKSLVLVFVAFVAVAIVLQVGMNLRQTAAVQHRVAQLLDVDVPLATKVQSLQFHTVQVQQWFTDVSATRGLDGLDSGFAEAARHADMFRRTVREIEQIDTLRRSEYGSLLTTFNRYYSQGEKMARVYVEEGPIGGNPLMVEFDKSAQQLNERLTSLTAAVVAEVSASEAALTAHVAKDRSAAVAFAGLYGVMLLAMFVGVNKFLLGPLCRSVRLSKELAHGNGDLTRRLDETQFGEFGQLAAYTNTFVAKVQDNVRGVEQGVVRLVSAVSQLTGAAQSTRDVMELQKQETDQVATAIDEMTATIHEVARNAGAAVDSARQADREAVSGREVVDETMRVIQELASEVADAAGVISGVEEHTAGIGKVSDVIRDIAEQTNLLALNAAIEAARAGEQGRGFAVVADEVRSLAQRTQESTLEIQSIVERLQGSVRNAVSVMEAGRTQADAGVGQAQKADKALSAIVAEVANINDMNALIASAAEEQSAVSEEINRNVVNIRSVSERTTEETHNLTRSGDELMDVVSELKGLVAKFRV